MALTPKDIRELFTQFYKELLTKDIPSYTAYESRHLVLSHVCKTGTNKMCAQLMAPFSEGELLDAMRALATDNYPGWMVCHRLFS